MRNPAQQRLTLLTCIFILSLFTTGYAADIDLIVRAKGTKANGVYPHFKLIVNDLECGSKYAASSCKEYCFSVPFEISDIKKIEIVFDNDHYSVGEDRNLFVNCIYVGNELPIKANEQTVKYVTKNGEEVEFAGLMEWNGSLIFDLTKIQIHSGNITLASQADVEAFSVQYVDGDLTISGNDIYDLSPLTSLSSVKGSLIISNNPNLPGIKGLNSLLEVGFLSIENNPKITSIEGLNVLMKCGGMYIGENKSLKTIKCFNSPDIL